MTEESGLPTLESLSVPITTTIAPIVRTLETELIETTLKTMNSTIGNITETIAEIITNVTESVKAETFAPTLAPVVPPQLIDWNDRTGLDADVLDCIVSFFLRNFLDRNFVNL